MDSSAQGNVPGMVDLELHLAHCKLVKRQGVMRAAADARLVLKRGDGGQEASSTPFKLVAPLGAIESKDLSWYLEQFYHWPWGQFLVRAQAIEAQLPKWGDALFAAALGHKSALPIYYEWKQAGRTASRRFTVLVEASEASSEASARLLSLPWELLHEDEKFLFQGGQPVRVRRRLPSTHSHPPLTFTPPLRVLLVSPRPEDEFASYIDHRVTAKPLAKALAGLGELVALTVLETPTFPAMRQTLLTAKQQRKPFHVVHFDGHGVYHVDWQLGGLVFEEPRDAEKLTRRGSKLVSSKQLADEIVGHDIPLVFLEACQSAQTEFNPNASVAGALLKTGVASVVAMSHSVLVESARRFVEAFYGALANGARIGEAMLAGQSVLHDETYRFDVPGAGELHIQDWFVPVLYQESEDPQLIPNPPKSPARKHRLQLGEVPQEPEHGFIGRSRDLLTLERVLLQKSYAVVLGEGGEGKTALAAELARWLVTIRRFRRAIFVSLETHSHARTVLDFLGKQLVEGFMESQPNAWATLETILEQEPTLVVLDNMESVLPPRPGMDPGVFDPEIWQNLLKLFKKFQEVEGTKLLFTSRERIGEPFSGNHVELGRLVPDEAMELVAGVLKSQNITPNSGDSGNNKEEIKALVEAVNGHARSLVLLAPELVVKGVKATTANLADIMKRLHQKYPHERERSLYASVELSLRRLSPALRQKIRVLGVFHGGAHLGVAAHVMELAREERPKLIEELTGTGLASKGAYGHLRFNPALAPYLDGELSDEEREQAQARWFDGMRSLADFLYQQRFQNIQLASTLTLLEIPNLLAALDVAHTRLEPEKIVGFAVHVEQLLVKLGRPAALARAVAVRTKAAVLVPEWGNARFVAEQMALELLLAEVNLPLALEKAKKLLEKSLAEGEKKYQGASYHIAMAYALLGQVLRHTGNHLEALVCFVESRRRFQALREDGQHMASVSLGEQGDCLMGLGRLDEAEEAYAKSILEDKALKDERGVAVGQIQLGTVYMLQKKYQQALDAYKESQERFAKLNEPLTVATAWHQMGIVYRESNQYGEAEKAYKNSLAIQVKENNRAGQADSLGELGNLCNVMGRLEDAAIFYRQAADIHIQLNDLAKEGLDRSNLAYILIKLKKFDAARVEVMRAIECKAPFGHAATPWTTWDILHELELATNHPQAAAQAREEARKRFLAYRWDGGENHQGSGQLCIQVLQAIQAGAVEQEKALLAKLVVHSELPNNQKPMIPVLQKIVAGSRDPALADDPALYYSDACELILLLEQLS
ncbi:MAG: tetratricopeptide repeat protein [Magnetococcus sp. YQC-5]